jgi:hypothetical protein
MSKQLSDVHHIAEELLRMGEMSPAKPDVSGKVIRVSRSDGPIMPSATIQGLETEIQRLSSVLERVCKSVECVEAHVLLQDKHKTEDVATYDNIKRRGWLVPALVVSNLVATLLLVNVYFEGQLLTIAQSAMIDLKTKLDIWLKVST